MRLDQASREANINLSGSYLEQPSKLKATLRGSDLALEADWGDAKLKATGDVEKLSATGNLQISDLSKLVGVAGNASAKLEWKNNILSIDSIRANAAGFEATGSAKLEDGVLSLGQSKISGTDLSGNIVGTLLPKLDLRGAVKTTYAFAPLEASISATGTLESRIFAPVDYCNKPHLGLLHPTPHSRQYLMGKIGVWI